MPAKAYSYLTTALLALAMAPLWPPRPRPCLPSQTRRRRPPQKWPIKDNTYVIKNFKFGTGETLPELKLEYITLGQPHRNAEGHVDNAILLLHGTGGDAHTLLNPVFSNVLFGPGQPFDITEVLPHPPRRHRPGQLLQALRRPPHEVPPVRLRRHGPLPIHHAH